jgi:hypothetical protein
MCLLDAQKWKSEMRNSKFELWQIFANPIGENCEWMMSFQLHSNCELYFPQELPFLPFHHFAICDLSPKIPILLSKRVKKLIVFSNHLPSFGFHLSRWSPSHETHFLSKNAIFKSSNLDMLTCWHVDMLTILLFWCHNLSNIKILNDTLSICAIFLHKYPPFFNLTHSKNSYKPFKALFTIFSQFILLQIFVQSRSLHLQFHFI